MFEVRRLRLLRELAHRGTLHAVAAALNYSPSTVSQQLARLETEVGGVLRVAAFQTAAFTLLPAAITRLAAEHPGLRVHLTEAEPEQAVPALLARDFDLVVAEEYPGHPRRFDADTAELRTDPIRWAVPPQWSESPATRPWVMEPPGTAARDWAVGVCRAAGFEPDVRYQSSDLLLHVRLVETGHAVAFLPDLVWGGGPPTVPVRPLPGAPAQRRISTLVRWGNAGHPAIRALRAALA